MAENTTNCWQEIREGLGVSLKIMIYTLLSMGLIAGAGYVYYNYFY
jgi:hypothetical protein